MGRQGERDRETERGTDTQRDSNSFLKPGPELRKEDDKDLP